MRSGRNWPQRIALALSLLPAAVRYAGGLIPFAVRVANLLRVQGYGAAVSWFVAAASYDLRNDAMSYRAWLARDEAQRGIRESGRSRLVVYTTLGLSPNDVATYGRAFVHRSTARADYLVVSDEEGCATLHAQTDDRIDQFELVVRETLSLDSLLATVRDRTGGYEEVVLLRPGFVVGALSAVTDDGAVLFYGDEDVLSRDGRRAPYFKPGFSIDLLLAEDYLSSCLVMNRELAGHLPREHVEDFASLALHLVERADRVEHVARFFCHRVLDVDEPAARYFTRFVERRYPGARVDSASRSISFVRQAPTVSVIIPTRDRLDLLKPCVEGIIASNRDAPEVIILDNGSTDAATIEWLAEQNGSDMGVSVIEAAGEFNWSALNNRGMEAATGDVFVFLNNDILPRSRDWLARLADVALREDVGVVGTLLVYPDEKIQHAGVVVGFGGAADHIYCGTPLASARHLFVDPELPRNVSAVTGACQAISRRTIDRIGPFDEEFVVVGSDIELCLRAIEHDLINVYMPSASLYHLESQTRSRRDPIADTERTRVAVARHGRDRFYNPNLSLLSVYPSYPI